MRSASSAVPGSGLRDHPAIVDARFSLIAACATAIVAAASAAGGTWPVAIVFGMLALGFLLRALQGYRRR